MSVELNFILCLWHLCSSKWLFTDV